MNLYSVRLVSTNISRFSFKPVLALLCASLLLLSGCALFDPKPADQQRLGQQQRSIDISSTDVSKKYWWRAAVRMHWPEAQPTAWYMDSLLAHQVFKPVLIQYGEGIELWRFHRRAVRDTAGHRFSFIFYSTRPVAEVILNQLAGQPLLQELLDAHMVEKVSLFELNQEPKNEIEATSDKRWSLPMQRAWPYFGMGVSQLWLGLIDHHAALGANERQAGVESDLDELKQYYQKIEAKLDATWKNEGNHALLHHLNALFGYDELVVYEKRLMRF